MVYRVFVEKKPELANDARALLDEARQLPGVAHLENVRILNRYDVENITPELFDYAVKTVFSEPQVDIVRSEADTDGASVFAVEYLPGQFDQRADSAAQCIQIISQGERPDVRTAKVYLLYGALSESEIAAVKKHVINPVDSREASFALPETQVVLPLLESDLLTVMMATTNGTLRDTPVRFRDACACCVVMASEGYPQSYEKGFPLTMDGDAAEHTFIAGAQLRSDGVLVTSGGRVAGVTAVAPTLPEAVKAAYERTSHVHFANAFCRRDIGARALQALGKEN